MKLIDSSPTAAALFYSEVPKLKIDRNKMHISRWLTAIEWKIVETYSGQRQIRHLGRHWALLDPIPVPDYILPTHHVSSRYPTSQLQLPLTIPAAE